MNKLFLAQVMFLVSTATAVAADKVELIKGEFRDGYQHLAVKNNTTSTIGSVSVDCGFFRDKLLVDTGGDSFFDLLPGQTGYGSVVTNAKGVTNVDCRISTVDRTPFRPDR
jgi:hypothetical protein